jgi:hypothetical protein
MPFFAVGTNYSPTENSLEGIQTPEYNATVGELGSMRAPELTHCISLTNMILYAGFYYVTLAILTFVYLICSLRTNVCLFLALFLLVITFGLFAGTYFELALGNLEYAAKLQKVRDSCVSSII